MTGRRFLPWLARTALIASTLTAVFAGCSRQSEGERCDKDAAGDTDCNDGLYCIRCKDLRSGQIDRCCPKTGSSDPNCARSDPPRPQSACEPPVASGGKAGSGGMSGSGGKAGSGGMSGSGGSGAATAGSSGSGGESGAPDSGGMGGGQ